MASLNPSENPPAFAPHVIELESLDDSKITNVAVYSGRAEVTRQFRFSVKAGQNQVHISGLSNLMDPDSLRVEGRGAGTIQEVSTSVIEPPKPQTTSPRLKELLREQQILDQSAYRSKQTIKSLDLYIESILSSSTPSSQLKEVVGDYHLNIKKAQDETLAIQDKLEEVREKIQEERKKLEGKKRHFLLNQKASIGIFADETGDVEIGLVYAVTSATWRARYDIRVNTQTKEKSVVLVYKGSLQQNTGEDWTDVPLVLETATPTFDKSIPLLPPWTISIDSGIPRPYSYGAPPGGPVLSPAPLMASVRLSRVARPAPLPEMSVRGAEVSSKTGNVSATFTVPGKMTIPSDDSSHNVTIVQLTLDAKMTWVSVPKKDTKVHLSAKIKNSSEFLLLEGPASVYVDGSFISRSNVPAVSPDESFECPLGLDPAIKVTYHPQIKKLSKSGLINKSDVYLFTQRVTVHNTKSIDVENVRVVDQIHVSEDARIGVKLIVPALQLPTSPADAGSIKSGKGFASFTSGGSKNTTTVDTPGGTLRIPAPVKVTSGVIAKWDYGGEEEEDLDVASLGKNGKINFVCALPAQGKENLTLQWEVTAPIKTKIAGL